MTPMLGSALLEIGGKLIDRLFPDENARDQAKIELLKMQQAGELQTITAAIELHKNDAAIGQTEAASADPYTSRWRPTVGYILAAALAFYYVINPLILWVATLSGHAASVPAIGIDDHLWELISGMLGLSAWRTIDKLRGNP